MSDNETLLHKGECPQCGGKKTLATYADGHAFCFKAGCGYMRPPTGGSPNLKVVDGGKAFDTVVTGELLTPDWLMPANKDGSKLRRLPPEALRKYGVFAHGVGGRIVQAYPYFDKENREVAQKLRTPDKDFPVLKGEGYENLGKCLMFGQQVFGDRFDRQVVITEGELDAISVAQATAINGEFKLAAVSIGTGAANAAKHIKENYLWLDRFAEIILWFDNDAAGKLATEECAKLFKVGKVRIATATGLQLDGKTPCKDASDILQANRPGDIKTCLYAAVAYRPAGIVNAKDNGAFILAPREKVHSYSYPPMMEKLQEMTGGMFPGEVVYQVAGTGVGKSTQFGEIQHGLIQQGIKFASFGFEDTKRDALFRLMSITAGERLNLVPVPDIEDAKALAAYDKKMMGHFEKTFGSGLVELFDPETAEWSMDAMLAYVRYCRVALDCLVGFIDPMSFLAAGLDAAADERRVLDKIAAELAKLSKELGMHLQVAHHLKRTMGTPHEEGAPTSLNELRSSGGLANFANYVVGWERNNQAEGDGWRVTQARVLKPSRRTGKSGLADVLYYGEDGRLVKSHLPFPPIGKPEEAGGDENTRKHGGFPPAGDGGY